MSCSLTQNHMYVPDLLNTPSMLTHLQSYKSISPMTRAPLGDCAGRGPRDRQNGMENDRDGTWVRCGFGWSFVAAVWAGSQCLVVYFFPPRIYSFFFPLFFFYRTSAETQAVIDIGPPTPCEFPGPWLSVPRCLAKLVSQQQKTFFAGIPNHILIRFARIILMISLALSLRILGSKPGA
jgi:hypothetical protein